MANRLRRPQRQVEGELGGDREHQQREQETQLLAAQPRPEPGADLRPDDAADAAARSASTASTVWFV